jgi:hypothetical protein
MKQPHKNKSRNHPQTEKTGSLSDGGGRRELRRNMKFLRQLLSNLGHYF